MPAIRPPASRPNLSRAATSRAPAWRTSTSAWNWSPSGPSVGLAGAAGSAEVTGRLWDVGAGAATLEVGGRSTAEPLVAFAPEHAAVATATRQASAATCPARPRPRRGRVLGKGEEVLVMSAMPTRGVRRPDAGPLPPAGRADG